MSRVWFTHQRPFIFTTMMRHVAITGPILIIAAAMVGTAITSIMVMVMGAATVTVTNQVIQPRPLYAAFLFFRNHEVYL